MKDPRPDEQLAEDDEWIPRKISLAELLDLVEQCSGHSEEA